MDAYKLSSRAVKYGVLFVLLTFAGFFLTKLLNSLPIHPVQYLLIGFGLAIFFLLLISLSEHLPFAAAYSISSVACIGLLLLYLTYVLRSVAHALMFSGLLTLLYSALYGLLISEDNALLLGRCCSSSCSPGRCTSPATSTGTAAAPSSKLPGAFPRGRVAAKSASGGGIAGCGRGSAAGSGSR